MQEPQVLQLQRETNSSIELQRAKDGTYYWTVKVYWEWNHEAAALITLAYIDKDLRATYLPQPEATE